MPVQVSYDSELMDQLIPAVPIEPSRRFETVLDENNRPLVFSIGNDNIFYLVIADENGLNTRQNFGARLGFHKNAQAFSVSQAEDRKLIVVFAMQRDDNSYGDIRILGPIEPADLRKADLYLRSFILRTVAQPSNLMFERILLVGFISIFLSLSSSRVSRDHSQATVIRLSSLYIGTRRTLTLPNSFLMSLEVL